LSIQDNCVRALASRVVNGSSGEMGKVHAGRLAWCGTILFFVVGRKERLVTLALELKQKYGAQAYASLANEMGLKRAAERISADERITAP
jgi:short-subunit dehydrogenase